MDNYNNENDTNFYDNKYNTNNKNIKTKATHYH